MELLDGSLFYSRFIDAGALHQGENSQNQADGYGN